MKIEFDPTKDAANLAKHGISLAVAAEFDLPNAVVLVDSRKAYGEIRFRAFGRMNGKGHCLAFTWRGSIVRVISIRVAREKEMRSYGV